MVPNDEQKQLIVDYMMQHTDLARSRLYEFGCTGKDTMKMNWEKLSKYMSQHGHPVSPENCISMWQDIRSKVKAKTDKITNLYRQSGNDTEDIFTCYDKVEVKVQNIFKDFGLHDGVVTECGFSNVIPCKNDFYEKFRKSNKVMCSRKVPNHIKILFTFSEDEPKLFNVTSISDCATEKWKQLTHLVNVGLMQLKKNSNNKSKKKQMNMNGEEEDSHEQIQFTPKLLIKSWINFRARLITAFKDNKEFSAERQEYIDFLIEIRNQQMLDALAERSVANTEEQSPSHKAKNVSITTNFSKDKNEEVNAGLTSSTTTRSESPFVTSLSSKSNAYYSDVSQKPTSSPTTSTPLRKTFNECRTSYEDLKSNKSHVADHRKVTVTKNTDAAGGISEVTDDRWYPLHSKYNVVTEVANKTSFLSNVSNEEKIQHFTTRDENDSKINAICNNNIQKFNVATVDKQFNDVNCDDAKRKKDNDDKIVINKWNNLITEDYVSADVHGDTEKVENANFIDNVQQKHISINDNASVNNSNKCMNGNSEGPLIKKMKIDASKIKPIVVKCVHPVQKPTVRCNHGSPLVIVKPQLLSQEQGSTLLNVMQQISNTMSAIHKSMEKRVDLENEEQRKKKAVYKACLRLFENDI